MLGGFAIDAVWELTPTPLTWKPKPTVRSMSADVEPSSFSTAGCEERAEGRKRQQAYPGPPSWRPE